MRNRTSISHFIIFENVSDKLHFQSCEQKCVGKFLPFMHKEKLYENNISILRKNKCEGNVRSSVVYYLNIYEFYFCHFCHIIVAVITVCFRRTIFRVSGVPRGHLLKKILNSATKYFFFDFYR